VELERLEREVDELLHALEEAARDAEDDAPAWAPDQRDGPTGVGRRLGLLRHAPQGEGGRTLTTPAPRPGRDQGAVGGEGMELWGLCVL
jgi:hypothetical protein